MEQASTDRPFATLEERLVYSSPGNQWLKLYFDHVRFPDNSEGGYNRVVEGEGRPGVAILPLLHDSIGLVQQYRYPVGRLMWEIPRGFGESDDPRDDATRELREETGLEVKDSQLADLGVMYPNSGLLTSTVHLFAARIADARSRKVTVAGEILRFQWIPRDEAIRQAAVGDLSDAFTLCALFRAQQLQLV